MNKLFNILMQSMSIPSSFSWYAKRSETVVCTTRMEEMVSIIMSSVPQDRRALFAATVCYIVMRTRYAPEIIKLDPDNTYVAPIRPTTAEHSDPDYCINDLILPIAAYRGLLNYLEQDLLDIVDNESWFDLIGAACLQLLREANR